jgi:hypothetical protein
MRSLHAEKDRSLGAAWNHPPTRTRSVGSPNKAVVEGQEMVAVCFEIVSQDQEMYFAHELMARSNQVRLTNSLYCKPMLDRGFLFLAVFVRGADAV